MSVEYDWVDGEYNKLTVNQISDRYLKNILRFLCNGGGYHDYLDEDKITKLFNEADKREIKHPYKLKDAIHAYRDIEIYEELSYMHFGFGHHGKELMKAYDLLGVKQTKKRYLETFIDIKKDTDIEVE